MSRAKHRCRRPGEPIDFLELLTTKSQKSENRPHSPAARHGFEEPTTSGTARSIALFLEVLSERPKPSS
jgi:hypothetical protein